MKDESQIMLSSSSSQIDEEPISVGSQTDEHKLGNVSSDNVKRDALSNLKRELTEEELNTPGAIRLLLSKVDDYDNCQKDLQKYMAKYHERDKQCAVLETLAKSNTAFEILYSFSLSVGSALIGLVPSVNMDGSQSYLQWILGSIGIVALVGGIIAKIFKA